MNVEVELRNVGSFILKFQLIGGRLSSVVSLCFVVDLDSIQASHRLSPTLSFLHDTNWNGCILLIVDIAISCFSMSARLLATRLANPIDLPR